MDHEFVIDPAMYQTVRAHLLQGTDEQVAFVFADVTGDGSGLRFTALDYYLAGPEDFEYQSGYHITLTGDALGRAIKGASDREATLVELHSHPDPGYPAAFSPSDMSGFDEVVPHVRWRLRGQPYMALVVGPDGFDALVWTNGTDVPEPLARMIVGTEIWAPSGLTLPRHGGTDGHRPV